MNSQQPDNIAYFWADSRDGLLSDKDCEGAVLVPIFEVLSRTLVLVAKIIHRRLVGGCNVGLMQVPMVHHLMMNKVKAIKLKVIKLKAVKLKVTKVKTINEVNDE